MSEYSALTVMPMLAGDERDLLVFLAGSAAVELVLGGRRGGWQGSGAGDDFYVVVRVVAGALLALAADAGLTLDARDGPVLVDVVVSIVREQQRRALEL
jgi:hypothetical protein